jgi:hypothetical protein
MTATASQLPPGCATGIGSLPFLDPRAATAFVARECPLVPFWPQLPRRSPGEGAIAQGLGPAIDFLEPAGRPFCWRVRRGAEREFAAFLGGAAPGLLPETAAGFFAFERALRGGAFPRALAVKAQMEGPVTLAHCLFRGEEPLAGRPEWIERLASFLAGQAVWQVERLRAAGLPVILLIDEPALALANPVDSPQAPADPAPAIARVLRAAREAGALVGVHCCAPLPARRLLGLGLDVVSFDAHLPLDGRAFAELAQETLERGGLLAFGLVRTDSRPGPGDDAQRFARWLSLAALVGDVPLVARRTLVTATCGLGLTHPSHARASFDECRRIGAMVATLGRSLHATMPGRR